MAPHNKTTLGTNLRLSGRRIDLFRSPGPVCEWGAGARPAEGRAAGQQMAAIRAARKGLKFKTRLLGAGWLASAAGPGPSGREQLLIGRASWPAFGSGCAARAS